MQRRNLITFSLLLISILFIAGCKEGAVGGNFGKLRGGQDCGSNEDCQSNKCELIPGGRKICIGDGTGSSRDSSGTGGNPCVGLPETTCKNLAKVEGCKPIYTNGRFDRCEKEGVGAVYDIEASYDKLTYDSRIDSLYQLGTQASGQKDYAYGVKDRKTSVDMNGDGILDNTLTREFSTVSQDTGAKYNTKYQVSEVTMSGEEKTTMVVITALAKDSDKSTDLAFVFNDKNGNGVIDRGETAELRDLKRSGDEGKIRDATNADLKEVLTDLDAQMEKRKQDYQEEIKKKKN